VGLVYLHSDHLGSVSAMSDEGGALVSGSAAQYYPFGAFRGTRPATNPDVTDLVYTGHRSNNTGANDLGLIYMNARYYVPSLARFASADTIVPDPADPQSFNRYSYVENRPTRMTDPSGNCGGEASLVWDPNQSTYVWTYTADYEQCNNLRQELEGLYRIEVGWNIWVLREMLWFELALQDMAAGFGGPDNFAAVFEGTRVKRYDRAGNSETSWPLNEIQMENGSFSRGAEFARWMFIHEFGHRLDIITGLTASIALEAHTRSRTTGFLCGLPGVDLFGHCGWNPNGSTVSDYARDSNRREDWGEAFTASMFGGDWTNLVNNNAHGIRADALTVAADRIAFAREQIPSILEALDAAPTWGEP
jgi:RHS repeat-associated protein